ncbi:MAG: hypothetical protein NWE89_01610 [Candidatus Bathyarchaeota archaeon]|nr:hypothetical protein [Candidatus Bathyarchaeota archaeon]
MTRFQNVMSIIRRIFHVVPVWRNRFNIAAILMNAATITLTQSLAAAVSTRNIILILSVVLVPIINLSSNYILRRKWL